MNPQAAAGVAKELLEDFLAEYVGPTRARVAVVGGRHSLIFRFELRVEDAELAWTGTVPRETTARQLKALVYLAALGALRGALRTGREGSIHVTPEVIRDVGQGLLEAAEPPSS